MPIHSKQKPAEHPSGSGPGTRCGQCWASRRCDQKENCPFIDSVQKILDGMEHCLVVARANASALSGTGYEPEDIVQEVALNIIVAQLESPDPGKLTKAYLARAVINLVRTKRRPKYRSYFIYGTEVDLRSDSRNLIEMLPTNDKDPARVFEEKNAGKQMMLAVEKLNPQEREVLDLHLEGHSLRTGAAALGISLGQYRLRLWKVQSKLRKVLLEL